MSKKEDFIQYAKQINEIAYSVDCGSEEYKNNISTIENGQLVIPVVGDFSSGKSSFINDFLGDSVLPVAVHPETAYATELHYSEENYILAMKNETEFDRYSVDEIKNINGDYKFLKLFLNNSNVKSIEPLILVDMPGFDSPRDDHNKAIISYLDKGSHYIILIPANAGTITNSLRSQIIDIKNFGHSMSFFISKSNIPSPRDLQNVLTEIKNRLEDDLDIYEDPISIGQNDGQNLQKIISTLNPEQMFTDNFSGLLKNSIYKLDSSINTKISASKFTEEEVNNSVEEIERGIKKIQLEQQTMLNDVNLSRAPEEDAVIDKIGRSLNDNIDNLVQIGLNSGEEAMKDEINNIIRNTLSSEVPQAIQNFNEKICLKFENTLKQNSSILDTISNPDFISNIESNFLVFGDSITKLNQATKNSKLVSNVASSVIGIVGLATGVFAPIVTVALSIIPQILNSIFGTSRQNQAKEQLKSSLQNSIVSIKSQIRPKLHEIFNEQRQARANEIGQKYQELLAQKQEELKVAQAKIQENQNVKEKIIEELEQAKVKLQEIKNKIY